jgi:DNA polymerase-3 subunit alpha
MENTDKVIKNINEIRNMGIAILPPDINASVRDFAVHASDIRFGLGAVKGVGDAALEAITEARQDGPFHSLHDFCERVDLRRVNRRVIEALIKCGAFDSLGGRRAPTLAQLDEAVETGQKLQRERELGQESLFGTEQIIAPRGGGAAPAADEEWPENLLLANEKEALGFYITGHPLARHSAAIKRFATCDAAGLAERADREEVSLCGIVAGSKELTTKKGERMAFITLEDLSGFVEMVIFPEVYQAAGELLKSEEPLLVRGTVDAGEEAQEDGEGQGGSNGRGSRGSKLLVSEVLSLKEVRERLTRRVHIRLTTPGLDEPQLRALRDIVGRYRGECEGLIHLVIPNRSETVVRLPDDLRLQACDELMDDAEKLFGYNVVTFE